MAYFKTKDGRATAQFKTNPDPHKLVEISPREYEELTEKLSGAKATKAVLVSVLEDAGVTDPAKQELLLRLIGGNHG